MCTSPYQELIQNAEDAGATHVKFLHDKNSYGTAKLFDDCEELAENQVRKYLQNIECPII